MTDPQPPSGLWRGAFQVVLAYAIFASLWILLSDRAMSLMFTDHELLVQAGMVKGWLFVAVTSLLLYVLVRRLVDQIKSVHAHGERVLRESEQRFRSIFDNSMDAVFLTATDGRFLAASPAAQKLFGYTEAEFVMLGRAAIVDMTDPRLARALAEREKTGSFMGELFMHRKDGSRIEVELSSQIFTDPEGRQLTSMFIRDITERKQAETELKHRNVELERFNHAAIEREMRMIALKQEVNALAHELGRTPPYALEFLKDDKLP
jgi:PAS domain S-box-containing protein